MKKKISIALLPIYFIVSPAWAGHLQVDNRSGKTIKVECGHDGDHGVLQSVSNGHQATMPINHSGQIKCNALDLDHGNIIKSSHFSFQHGDEKYVWLIDHH